jgi:hypothetical protein
MIPQKIGGLIGLMNDVLMWRRMVGNHKKMKVNKPAEQNEMRK